MWPFRTTAESRRERRVRKLRAAQERGEACVLCGKRWPRPVQTMYANGISGWACDDHPRPCLPLPSLPSGVMP